MTPLPLTPREAAVLRLVAQGYSNPDIAAKLGTKLSTVSHQLLAAMQRIKATSRAHAVAILDDNWPGWREPMRSEPAGAAHLADILRGWAEVLERTG